MKDVNECLATFLGEQSEVEFLDWCYFMLGHERDIIARLARVTEVMDSELHEESWKLFYQWQNWQIDE